jgi:hypothetical protein
LSAELLICKAGDRIRQSELAVVFVVDGVLECCVTLSQPVPGGPHDEFSWDR